MYYLVSYTSPLLSLGSLGQLLRRKRMGKEHRFRWIRHCPVCYQSWLISSLFHSPFPTVPGLSKTWANGPCDSSDIYAQMGLAWIFLLVFDFVVMYYHHGELDSPSIVCIFPILVLFRKVKICLAFEKLLLRKEATYQQLTALCSSGGGAEQQHSEYLS